MGRPSVALYIQDTTKRVEKQLMQMKEYEEKQVLRQAETLTSMVSHELQTPILTIIFFIRQILAILNMMDQQDPQMQLQQQQSVQYCEIVLCQLELTNIFVHDLLDLRQIKFGKPVLKLAPFNVVFTIQSICENFKTQIKMNNQQLCAKIGTETIFDSKTHVCRHAGIIIPKLIGDEGRFKQVLVNLIKNATKFTNQGLIEI